jgi:preprotein translocase subunit YajC
VIPARRRRTSHAAMQESIAVADEVITAGGIHGSVRQIVDDVVHVEIAPGVVVHVDRRAIAAVAREVDVEVEADPAAESTPSADPDESARGAIEEPG